MLPSREGRGSSSVEVGGGVRLYRPASPAAQRPASGHIRGPIGAARRWSASAPWQLDARPGRYGPRPGRLGVDHRGGVHEDAPGLAVGRERGPGHPAQQLSRASSGTTLLHSDLVSRSSQVGGVGASRTNLGPSLTDRPADPLPGPRLFSSFNRAGLGTVPANGHLIGLLEVTRFGRSGCHTRVG